jgi:hypothetical protein
MTSGIYNRFKANLMNKVVDMEGDTIKVALLSGSHSFTATHNTWSEVSANELASGNGYTTGGAALGNKAVTQAATTKFDADDTSWTSASFTTSHAVIYDDTLGSDDLIASIDFGGAQTISSGTFKIEWHTDGIITLA